MIEMGWFSLFCSRLYILYTCQPLDSTAIFVTNFPVQTRSTITSHRAIITLTLLTCLNRRDPLDSCLLIVQHPVINLGFVHTLLVQTILISGPVKAAFHRERTEGRLYLWIYARSLSRHEMVVEKVVTIRRLNLKFKFSK